ncbi:MAG: T9SS type A sorting domain-containing protein [Sphingobacteriales bacterium]|nr:T9SS type A sorting domain-containing protein [Sphingobacteriales bacterium]
MSFQSAENGTAVIEVFDLQGRNVLNGYRQDVETAQNYQIYFHTAGLPAGLYFVKIQIQGREQIFKMKKE